MSGRGSTVSDRYLPTTNEKPSETMFQRVLLDFVIKSFGLGAENETRTRDPNLGKVVLYQLSYFRKICCLNLYNLSIASAKVHQKFYSANFFATFLHFFYPHTYIPHPSASRIICTNVLYITIIHRK